MRFSEKINPLSILAGFVIMYATSMILWFVSLDLINITVSFTGSLIHRLFISFISVVTGVIVTSKMARRVSIFNSIGVVLVYCLFIYWLRQYPSLITTEPDPTWYSILSYVVLVASAFVGHLISAKLIKNV